MLSRYRRHALSAVAPSALLLGAQLALAQDLGVPPPEAEKVADVPKERDVLKIDKVPTGATASISAGGLGSTGNSRTLALTASGQYESRYGANGYGASLVGNYGRSAPPDGELETSTENLQGRLRYDRYVLDNASVFLLITGRHDRFQGLDFRLNLDPGFKYLFINQQTSAFWAEAGYDFQYDVRRDDALEITDDMGEVIETLDKTETDHSARLFVGMKHAFNDATALSSGLEYLQSFVETRRYRLNYDILFTAKVWGDLALGLGFVARYDHAPLPDKKRLDTTSTLSLVYSYSTVVKE